MGFLCCCGTSVVGDGICVWASMSKISSSYFKSAVCLSHIIVSGLVGVGLIRACTRYIDTYVAVSYDEIIGNGRVAGKNSLVLDTRSFFVLGV